jgi:endonuclease-3
MKHKAKSIAKILNDNFPSPAIPLEHKDPYTLLIAVLLSAQCTDERVNKVTPGLFAAASNPSDMSKLPVAKIEKLIKSCGLSPQKSKAISELSKILVEKYNSKVPKTLEELQELPGVGRKTASVVMSQAFGIPMFPVDTHIHRLAQRWGLSSGKNVTQTEKDLRTIFPEESWNKLHLQIIYYGRKYCPARGHVLENCEICRLFSGGER